jgi:hypothetical protein
MNIGVGASTDELGHPIFKVGKLIRNINFVAAATTEIQSIRLTASGADEGTTLVEHCHFVDIALTMEQTTGSARREVVVRNCKFSQTNTYADSASIMLPNTELTLLEGCIFEGAGYAGLLGEQTGYTNTKPETSVILRDCLFDKTGFTIDDASPLADVEAYLVIDGGASNNVLRVEIENCQIVVDQDATNGALLPPTDTVISASLDTTYLRHVYIRARETHVKNSLFTGPNTTFDVAATNYPLPCLEIVPYNSCHVMDSRFLSNAISLKIGGNISAFDNGDAVGAFVSNNIFYMATGISQTMLDIEINTGGGTWLPSVTVSNNNFLHTDIAAPGLKPYHPIFANDDAMGTVAIYAEDCDVRVDGNSIYTTLGDNAQSIAAGITSLAALVVETTNAGIAVTQTATHITNNHIVAINEQDADDVTYVYTAWIRGGEILVHDNHLVMDNEPGVGSNDYGCLYIENRESATASSVVTPATVSGNLFSRRPAFGGTPNDITFYIMVPAATEGSGLITGNSFCTPTTTTGNNQAYEDNSGVGLQWAVNTNKNQTATAQFVGAEGLYQINNIHVGYKDSTFLSSGFDVPSSTDGGINQSIWYYDLADVNGTRNFRWILGGLGNLPLDVTVISVHANYGGASVPNSTNSFWLRLGDGTGTFETITGAAPALGYQDVTLTPSGTFRNTPDGRIMFWMQWNARHTIAETRFLVIREFDVTYRW